MLLKRVWIRIPYKISIALLLTIISLGTGVYLYAATGGAINLKASSYPVEVTRKLGLDVKIEMTRFVNYSSQIIFSDTVQDGLPNYGKLNKSSKLAVKKLIEKQFEDRFLTIDSFIGAEIITEDGELIRYYVNPYYTFTYHDGSSDVVKSLRKLTDDRNQLPTWSVQNFPTGKSRSGKYIVLSRTIKSSITNERLGLLVIALKEDHFSGIYRNFSLGDNSNIFIVDAEGNPVHSGSNPWNPDDTRQIVKNIRDRDSSGESFFNYKIGYKSYSFIFSKLKDINWYVVSSFPTSSYSSGLHEISRYMIAAGIICLAIFLIILLLPRDMAGIFDNKAADNLETVAESTAYTEVPAPIIEKSDDTPKVWDDIVKAPGTLSCRREVKDALKYIEANYANEILVETVAKEQYISTSHLMHLFKEELGITFNEYLINYRMYMSKCLLKDSRYKIYEVSEKVGYKNVKYFSQTFKKIVGVTPREYIRNNT